MVLDLEWRNQKTIFEIPEFQGISDFTEDKPELNYTLPDPQKPAFQAISEDGCSKCSKSVIPTLEKAIAAIDSLNVREGRNLIAALLNQLVEDK